MALGLKSTFEVIAARETVDLTSHPKFKALIDGKSQAEAQAAAAALTARGIQFLDLPDLQAWARIKLEMARQSPALCAHMWTGNIDPRLVVHTLSELPESDLREWLRLTTNAALRTLEEAPMEPPGPEVTREGLEGVLDSLPARERQAVQQDMASQSLEDERACELMRLVLEQSAELPPGLQHDFLRALSLG